jgi:hypothetical protein
MKYQKSFKFFFLLIFGKVYKIDIFHVKHSLTVREIKHFNNLVREMDLKWGLKKSYRKNTLLTA